MSRSAPPGRSNPHSPHQPGSIRLEDAGQRVCRHGLSRDGGVDDLPAAIADLEARGAGFHMKPRSEKARIAFLKGPDFVSIELMQSRR